jgi:hypothetical protein
MRLFTAGLAASRFTLAVAVILLFSPNSFAQHSGGGGSSGGGSASAASGGGGSHGGSSGGGSASSGGGHSSGGGSSSHSSGGSASHSSGGSSSHSSSAHSSSSGSASSRSDTSHPSTPHSNTASNNLHPVHAPSTGSRGQSQTPQKRGFFSFLRHHVPMPLPNPPNPKPEPKEPVARVRPPLCFRGPCPVCPVGHMHGGSGCEGTFIRDRIRRVCPAGESWINGACLQQTWYQDQCAGLRTMMERQAQRMRAAQLDRQITCSIGPWQQCSDSTTSAESEAGFYQELQNKYQACQRRSPTPLPHTFRIPGYSAGLSSNSLSFELDHH